MISDDYSLEINPALSSSKEGKEPKEGKKTKKKSKTKKSSAGLDDNEVTDCSDIEGGTTRVKGKKKKKGKPKKGLERKSSGMSEKEDDDTFEDSIENKSGFSDTKQMNGKKTDFSQWENDYKIEGFDDDSIEKENNRRGVKRDVSFSSSTLQREEDRRRSSDLLDEINSEPEPFSKNAKKKAEEKSPIPLVASSNSINTLESDSSDKRNRKLMFREVSFGSPQNEEKQEEKQEEVDEWLNGSPEKNESKNNKSNISKEDALAMAMGKLPSFTNKDGDTMPANNSINLGRPGSTGSSAPGGLLRPSKYSKGAPNTKRASFDLDNEANNDDFKPVSIGPRFSQPQSTTFRSSRGGNDSIVKSSNTSSNSSNSASKYQPRRNSDSGGSRFRRSSSNEEATRSSLTKGRPGIARRRSSEDLMKMGEDEGGKSAMPAAALLAVGRMKRRSSLGSSRSGEEARGSITRSLPRSVTMNQQELRRQEMSTEQQIYVPPKSRHKGILQAYAHVMSGKVVNLVLWTYGASFTQVLLFFLTVYVFNIFFWAGILDLVDRASGGTCVNGEDSLSLTVSERYEFAFELSWSTFTTVGYGAVSPPGDEAGCYAIRLACAFVAFTGVLFASTTAALMYSKLMRLLAQAQCTFSSTLCVQYGEGNSSTVRYGQLNFKASVKIESFRDLLADEDEEDDNDDLNAKNKSEEGFPVIEFRILNDRANHEGSEIWDAQIRAIVQLHKEKSKDTFLLDDENEEPKAGASTLDLEKKVYYPVSLTPDSHPHFSRIWYARHVLNAESPLLKREMRDIIASEKRWDPDMNNWEEIRDCLNPFISLRITLSGTSAVSASTVFAEHVYEFDDVCVGWKFANMVYQQDRDFKGWWRSLGFGGKSSKEDDEGNDKLEKLTRIDAALLHDIVPQPNDHEPLEDTSSSFFPFNNH